MVYCSIEEAWGTNFTNNKAPSKTNYDKIVADNASDQGNNSDFGEVDFDKDNSYTSSGAPVLHRNRTSAYKKKRRKSFSRNMNRLPHHSGPDNRYPESRNSRHLEFTDNSNMQTYPTKRIRDANNTRTPSYKNTDTPISEYNDTLTQSLVEHEETRHTRRPQHKKKRRHIPTPTPTSTPKVEFESDGEFESESEYTKHTDSEAPGEEEFTDSESEYAYPEEESRRHKRETYVDLSESVHSNSAGRRRSKRLRENMFDIIIYVITGIFIIFILDVFVRLGKSVK